MKLIGYAIATIVDAKSGNGLARRAGEVSPVPVERSGTAGGGHSVGALLRAAGRAARSLYRRVAARAERRREIRQLAALSDHQLRDIGLHRGEIEALGLGKADLDELNRERRQRSAELLASQASTVAVGDLGLTREAANDASRDSASCA